MIPHTFIQLEPVYWNRIAAYGAGFGLSRQDSAVQRLRQHTHFRSGKLARSYLVSRPSMISKLCVCLLFFGISPALAMSFSIDKVDPRPVRSVVFFVYGEGKITSGDTERFSSKLQSAGFSTGDEIQVYLHSPGGSLTEGIKLSKLISKMGANTNVGRKTVDQQSSTAGICASACVIAYVGGRYRFLKSDSKLGVHQFAFDEKAAVGNDLAVAVSQIMSADIVEVLKNNRVDPAFFTLMTTTSPDQINFVSHDKLRDLRVVTDDIWDESWSFEMNDGATYLKIWQQSYNGENKLLLTCGKGTLIGFSFIQPPKEHLIGKLPFTPGIFIDGTLVAIPSQMVLQEPVMGPRFATSIFLIPDDISRRMLSAGSIGAAIQPPNKDIFLGFQIRANNGRVKLSNMITGCKKN